MIQKHTTFWTSFGPILGSILGPETAPEGDQKWDHFWIRPAPHLRGLQVAFSGIIREVCKGYWSWNYTLQKKGRDYPYTFLPFDPSYPSYPTYPF